MFYKIIILLNLVTTALAAQDYSMLEQFYLKASNVDANTGGDGGDAFGYSVAIDGNTMVVGARLEDGIDNLTTNSGAAYVFVKNNGIWTEQAYLKAPSPSSTDFFGHAVAISGDTIAVGAHLDNFSGMSNTGAVYIFTRSQEVWSFQAKLTAENPSSNAFFGYSISLDSGTLLVGAYKEDTDAIVDSGAAYVFVGAGASWTQQSKLTADMLGTGIGASDSFGSSVSLYANTAVVSAIDEDGIDDGNENNSGAVYVFQRAGTTWSSQAYLKASNLDALDLFGKSVAIFEDTLVISAPNEDGDSNNMVATGAVYIFTRSGVIWTEQTILRSYNSGASDLFGTSVAIDNDVIVVGAKFEDGDGIDGLDNNNTFNSGAAYVFIKANSSIQQTYLKASNADPRDEFGFAVAISGNTIVVGAPDEDSAEANNPDDNTFESNSTPFIKGAGAAYVFPADLVFSNGFEVP